MNTKQTLEKELNELTAKRKDLETIIQGHEQDFNIMKQLIEDDLETLKNLQNQEMELKIAIFNAKKDEIIDSLSINNLKNVISKSPIFGKVKDKAMQIGKEVSELFSETPNLDIEWLNSNYEKYKNICSNAGKEFINKEEFKSIIDATQTFAKDKTASVEKIYESIAKATGVAKEQISTVWDTLDDSKEETTDVNVENTLDKKSIFKEWFAANVSKKTKIEEKKKELYDSYVSFVINKYGQETLDSYGYTYISGAFTSALKREYTSTFK